MIKNRKITDKYPKPNTAFAHNKDLIDANRASVADTIEALGHQFDFVKALKNTQWEYIQAALYTITKATVNVPYPVMNLTPLHIACYYRFVDAIALLRACGANTTLTTTNYLTPSMLIYDNDHALLTVLNQPIEPRVINHSIDNYIPIDLPTMYQRVIAPPNDRDRLNEDDSSDDDFHLAAKKN